MRVLRTKQHLCRIVQSVSQFVSGNLHIIIKVRNQYYFKAKVCSGIFNYQIIAPYLGNVGMPKGIQFYMNWNYLPIEDKT